MLPLFIIVSRISVQFTGYQDLHFHSGRSFVYSLKVYSVFTLPHIFILLNLSKSITLSLTFSEIDEN